MPSLRPTHSDRLTHIPEPLLQSQKEGLADTQGDYIPNHLPHSNFPSRSNALKEKAFLRRSDAKEEKIADEEDEECEKRFGCHADNCINPPLRSIYSFPSVATTKKQ